MARVEKGSTEMRGNSDNPYRMRALRRIAAAGGAFLAIMALTGCSTGNLTGFDFPSFGLTKKSGESANDTAGYAGAPPSGQRLDTPY